MAAIAIGTGLALLFLAAFPASLLKSVAEDRLSDSFGRRVTIGSIERTPAISLSPTISVRGIRVPQAAWAGTGDLASIDRLSLRIPVLRAVFGRFAPERIQAEGVRLDLVRDARGRTNWGEGGSGGGGSSGLKDLVIRDAVVRYRDAKQDRAFSIRLAAEAGGIRGAGSGTVAGAAVRVKLRAPALNSAGAWPFAARIEGARLAMTAEGRMAKPLDLRDMTLRIAARADDLKLIDRIIEAGLFGTQPVSLSADVRRTTGLWRITNLRGTIGQSDIAGRLDVAKRDGRTRLDGEVRSKRLDFDDLASDEGQAAAVALERAQGLRLVPNTRVNIGKIDDTDGRLAFRIDRIVSSRRPSALVNARGVLAIDRQYLTVEPLRLGLARGTITGRFVVDQRGGRATPQVTLALDLTNSALSALGDTGGDVDARVDGRVRLVGAGDTIRAAVGRSNGRIGIVARDGALPATLAAMLGFDVGKRLLADGGRRAALRCAVVGLEVRGGRGSFAPLIVDTDASQTRGTGTVAFPDERIAATLTGAPKRDAILRLPGAVTVSGTLRDPRVTIPREVKSVGNVLKAIGRAVTGSQGPLASDADCAGLSRRAIGR